jgi:pilus assembly protein CpaF
MSDPTVTEIMVNAHDRIFVERTIPGVGSQLVPVLDTFESPMVLRRFIERMVEQTKDKTIDFENPTVDLSLPDGSRVNATIPPASRLGPTITIRRKRERFYSLDELQEFGAFSPEMRQFLHESNISGANMMSFGPTGSGKTTLLTALIDDKPRDRRIIVVEDTPEINIDINRHPNFISMLTSERRSMRDLVRNALRQRPDHLIVGETRDATAYDLIQAFNSGQTGSMSTIHARDPQSALVRLTNLVRQAEAAPTEEPARRMVAEAIHLLIFAARLPDGSRRIISIDEVLDLDDAFNFRTQNVFSLSIAGRNQNGRLNVTFVHNPNYVMGPSLAKLFADAGYDPEAWTGSIARAEGRRPELLMY